MTTGPCPINGKVSQRALPIFLGAEPLLLLERPQQIRQSERSLPKGPSEGPKGSFGESFGPLGED